MKKEEIITLANDMGFLLDYDRFDDKDYPGVANPDLRFLRFITDKENLDERELRWIWYKDDSDDTNIRRGKRIQSRLQRKAEVQQFLKY